MSHAYVRPHVTNNPAGGVNKHGAFVRVGFAPEWTAQKAQKCPPDALRSPKCYEGLARGRVATRGRRRTTAVWLAPRRPHGAVEAVVQWRK